MLKRFRDQVGTAGFIISIIALVAALSGGAYAANSALSGKQKKEVEKIAKKYAGKPGTTGAAGATGPSGAPGAAGKDGAAGVGTEGKEGKQGAPGESVEAVPVAGGGTQCSGNGGAVLEPEGIEICNGSPWAVGGLPPGKTEMGTWAIGKFTSETFVYAPISFTVPLAAGTTLGASSVHYVNENEEEGGAPATICLGKASEPTAPAGNVCIYTQAELGTIFQQSIGRTRAGLSLFFEANPVEVAPGETESASARGTWAVTAPTS